MMAWRQISTNLVASLGLLLVCNLNAQTTDDETKTSQQRTNTEQTIESDSTNSVPAEAEQKTQAQPKAAPSQPRTSRKSFRPSEEISEDRPVPFPVDI